MAIATATAIAIGVAVAAAGVGAYASVSAAQAQADAAKYNEAVARNDALAKQQQTLTEQARAKDRSRRVIASQRAALAKSGVSLSGSALDVLYDTSLQSNQDIQAIGYRGAVDQNRLLAGAGLYDLEAKNAISAGNWAAAGTLLGGASSAGSIYGDYRAKLPRVHG